jgi:hypothetical protein
MTDHQRSLLREVSTPTARAREAAAYGSRLAPGRRGYFFLIPSPITLTTQLRILAARCARGCLNLRPREERRAQGRPDARCTRGLVRNCAKKSAHEHTGPAENTRPSLRSGSNGFLRALLGDRAFLPPSLRGYFRKLDASVGASGPHDCPQQRRVRLSRRLRPPHPIPRP